MNRKLPLQSLCLIAAAALVTPLLPAPQAAAGDNVRWSITFGNQRGYDSSRYNQYRHYDRSDGYDRYDRYRPHHRHHRYCGCDHTSYRRVTYRPVLVHYDRPRYRHDYRQHRWSHPGLRFTNDRYDRYDYGRRGWRCD